MNPTGRQGETLAAAWLEARGIRVLDRNWRHGRYEIDIIARDSGTIAFVEVKTRRLGPGGAPAAAVNSRKRARLNRAAAAWIHGHPRESGPFRFDILEVVNAPGRAPLVEWTRDAFQADG
ncbi:MAG: YraN family protein [Gemmatimonadota bacterium]